MEELLDGEGKKILGGRERDKVEKSEEATESQEEGALL